MITYKEVLINGVAQFVKVYLENRRIGTIHRATNGWRYIPKGGIRFAGETFGTIGQVKASLEAE